MRRPVILILSVLLAACATSHPVPEPIPIESHPDERAAGMVRVSAAALNIRAAASTSAEVIGQARRGEQLALVEEGRGWSKIRTAAGQIGWVSSQYVERPGARAAKVRRSGCPPDSDFAFASTPMPSFTEGGPHGLVIVEANVNTRGDVTSTKLISNSTGEPAMATLAEREIRSAKFNPPVRDCAPRAFVFTYKRSF